MPLIMHEYFTKPQRIFCSYLEDFVFISPMFAPGNELI